MAELEGELETGRAKAEEADAAIAELQEQLDQALTSPAPAETEAEADSGGGGRVDAAGRRGDPGPA